MPALCISAESQCAQINSSLIKVIVNYLNISELKKIAGSTFESVYEPINSETFYVFF